MYVRGCGGGKGGGVRGGYLPTLKAQKTLRTYIHNNTLKTSFFSSYVFFLLPPFLPLSLEQDLSHHIVEDLPISKRSFFTVRPLVFLIKKNFLFGKGWGPKK